MLEMLKKKDISKITVSELAERADIGRGTFYLHYTDPYDLLDHIENEALDSVTSFIGPMSENWRHDQLLKHFERVWEYIYDNLEVFDILMKHQGGTRFFEKFKNYCEKSARAATGAQAGDVPAAYMMTYIVSGMLGIFQKWINEGASIPPSRLAQIARDVLGVPPEAPEARKNSNGSGE